MKLLGFIPLDLSGDQRQALATWGMLGGIFALCLLLIAGVMLLESHWSPLIERDLIKGLFRLLYFLTALQGLLAFGIVAIARGGSLKMSVTRDGATVEADAAGAAAAKLATDNQSLGGVQ